MIKLSASVTLTLGAGTLFFLLLGFASVHAQSVASIALVEANNAQTIMSVVNGQKIFLSTLPSTNLTIVATIAGSPGGSVKFALDGIYNHTENIAPYALCGKASPDYYSCPQLDVIGAHTLTVTSYTGANLSGSAGAALTINFEVAQSATTGVISFSLLDATTGNAVAAYTPLANGVTINLYGLGTQMLSVSAATAPNPVGSVKFVLDDNFTHVENIAPYSLCGKANPGYVTCPQLVVAGMHSLTATAYSGPNMTGTAYPPYTISFSVVSSGSGPAIRQMTSAYIGNVPEPFPTSLSVNFNQPTLPGSVIWVVVTAPDNDNGGTPFVFQVADTQAANRYSLLSQQNDYGNGDQSVAQYIAFSTMGGADKVTFKLTLNGNPAGGNYLGIFAVEVTGVSSTSFGQSSSKIVNPPAGANQVSSGPISASASVYVLAVSMNVDGGTSDTQGSGYGGPTVGTGLTEMGSMFWPLDGTTALATFAAGKLTPSAGSVTAYFNASPQPTKPNKNEYVTVAVGLH